MMHLNCYPPVKSRCPARQTDTYHFQEFLKNEMIVTDIYFQKKAQFVHLELLQNFATFTEEKIVAHYHFISCDTDSLVLFLGLII